MSSTERSPRSADKLTPEQRSRLEMRHVDRDRTLSAVHRLEAALSDAAPGREADWRAHVVDALGDLDAVTTEEHGNALQPEGLLSDIALTQPRLRRRVRGLRAAHQQVRDTITSSLEDLSDDPEPDVIELRRRLTRLLTAIRNLRSRESDLLFEAYFEAFHHDIEEDAADKGEGPGR